MVHQRRALPTSSFLAALLLIVSGLPAAAQAQEVTLTGRVLEDGAGRRAISGAAVEAFRLAPGTPVEPLPSIASGRTPDASGISDGEGRYSLDGLVAGDYLVRVSRLGYRTGRIHVRLDAAVARVSLALEVAPLPLLGIDATGWWLAAGGPGERGEVDSRALERLRRARYLSQDVRLIGRSEIFRAGTLAEPDAFRSLQRLPGVATESQWSAAPWTRGARWDLTLTRLDGVPLFNPYHAAGILSAVPADFVGSMTFHPGVAPASLPGGGAALLDVGSRGGPPAGLTGEATVSLASAGVSLGGALPTGPGSWRVQLRRSYVDWLVDALARSSSEDLPYSFHDAGGRLDLPLGDHMLEVSTFLESDGFTDEIPDVVHGTRASWRNGMARATLSSEIFGRRARHMLGLSRYRLDVESIPSRQTDNAPGLPPGEHGVGYVVFRGGIPRTSTEDRWSWGYEVARWSVDAGGLPPRPLLNYDTDAFAPSLDDGSLTVASAWSEARLRPIDRLEIDVGLRLEAGGAITGEDAVRWAPRLTARLDLGGRAVLSGGAGRSYQYIQALAPVLLLDQDFPAGYLWALAGADAPAIRSDVITLGLEGWLGDAWLAGGTLYHRWNDGILSPVTRAGPVEEGSFFSPVSGRTRGAELYMRRIGEGWSLESAYSYLLAREESGGRSHSAPGDRRHVLDLSTSMSVTGSLRADLGYTFASGAPYTRIWQECGPPDQLCPDDAPVVVGEPNGRRREPFTGLRMGLVWSREFPGWRLSTFLQVRNLLARSNPGAYSGTEPWCPNYSFEWRDGTTYCRETGEPALRRDTFTPGIPILPLLGLRIEF